MQGYSRAELLSSVHLLLSYFPRASLLRPLHTIFIRKPQVSQAWINYEAPGRVLQALALLSANLKGAGAAEYIIQAFDTQPGNPSASGTIASGSTVSFTVYMRKTASAGTPRAKLFLNGPTGPQLCTATRDDSSQHNGSQNKPQLQDFSCYNNRQH